MLYIALLILLGVFFLVVELLLLPGMSIGTILSLASFGVAIYEAFDIYGSCAGGICIAIVLVLSLIATVFSLRAKTWRKLALNQEIQSKSNEDPACSVKVGDCGVTVSRLAPMGKVQVGGRIYEAKSEGDFIDQKVEVEVVGSENFSVIVRKK